MGIDITQRPSTRKASLRGATPGFNQHYFALLVTAGLCAVFYLPYQFSPAPSASASYVFGYNNRIGIILLLLSVATWAIFTKGAAARTPLTRAGRPVSTRTLAVCLFAVLIGCGFMFFLTGRFGGFGESSYEIDRTWLLSLGKTPYVDFEWPFGITFLYGPLLLRSLFGITMVQGCYAFWTLNYLLGTWLLFAVVNRINYPTTVKRTIFLLVFASGFMSILTMGTHYTFLRYTLPLYCILRIEGVVEPGGVTRQAQGSLLAVLCTMLLLTISPETAIAHAFACVFVLLPAAPRSGRTIGVYAGTLLAFAAVFTAALKLHVLDTMRASGGGADSFPILPAPHILLFFLSLFVCACYLYRRLKHREFNDNTVGLLAFSVPMLAAALGRCDPFHVTWNGEAIFLACMFYVSNHKQAWKVYAAAFSLFLIALPGLTLAWTYLPLLGHARQGAVYEKNTSLPERSITWIALAYSRLRHHAMPDKALLDPLLLRGVVSENPPSVAALYPSWHGGFLAPFGYRPNGIGTDLTTEVEYGHYESFENANTTAAVATKLAEIERRPDQALLLPPDFDYICHPDERATITVLFLFPLLRAPRHLEGVHQPVCDYIHAHYALAVPPDVSNYRYGLWVMWNKAAE